MKAGTLSRMDLTYLAQLQMMAGDMEFTDGVPRQLVEITQRITALRGVRKVSNQVIVSH